MRLRSTGGIILVCTFALLGAARECVWASGDQTRRDMLHLQTLRPFVVSSKTRSVISHSDLANDRLIDAFAVLCPVVVVVEAPCGKTMNVAWYL